MSIKATRELIKEVLYCYPDLTYGGFAIRGDPKRTLQQHAADIRLGRKHMLTAGAVDEFNRCRRWLERQPRTVNINPRAGSSYSLKEEVEAESGYVSNGMFIAAAVACGYLVEQAARPGFSSQNAWLNIGAVRASNPNLHIMKPHPGAMRLLKGRYAKPDLWRITARRPPRG